MPQLAEYIHKNKNKNRKREKLKSDSVKIASVVFKNRLKTAVLLYYGRRWYSHTLKLVMAACFFATYSTVSDSQISFVFSYITH